PSSSGTASPARSSGSLTAPAAAAATAVGAVSPAASGAAAAAAPPSPRGPTLVARLVSHPDSSGLTPLHFAVAANCLPAVRLLLAAGAPYTAQASSDNLEAFMPCNAGWTCLHVAALRGHFDAALLVLSHHASLSSEQQAAEWRPARTCRSSDPRAIPDRRGSLAAALAAARRHTDLAALLATERPLSACLAAAAAGGGGVVVGPDGREVRPPAMFVCPITQDVMREPVVASDGFSYERAAIARWMDAGRLASPMTNLPFTSRLLFPNNVIMSAIKEWRQQHQQPDPTAVAAQAAEAVAAGAGAAGEAAGT
ncbi:hypothetical protein Agub_g4521, partial [Astrephomene gubernaculifera]